MEVLNGRLFITEDFKVKQKSNIWQEWEENKTISHDFKSFKRLKNRANT